MNSDSMLWVLVVPLIALTPDDRETDGLWNSGHKLTIHMAYIAQNDFTADETNNMKHTTK